MAAMVQKPGSSHAKRDAARERNRLKRRKSAIMFAAASHTSTRSVSELSVRRGRRVVYSDSDDSTTDRPTKRAKHASSRLSDDEEFDLLTEEPDHSVHESDFADDEFDFADIPIPSIEDPGTTVADIDRLAPSIVSDAVLNTAGAKDRPVARYRVFEAASRIPITVSGVNANPRAATSNSVAIELDRLCLQLSEIDNKLARLQGWMQGRHIVAPPSFSMPTGPVVEVDPLARRLDGIFADLRERETEYTRLLIWMAEQHINPPVELFQDD